MLLLLYTFAPMTSNRHLQYMQVTKYWAGAKDLLNTCIILLLTAKR